MVLPKIAVLTANLGNFDTPVDPVQQTLPFDFFRWTDQNFPPVTGLTPRLQYRIPKTHGWQMFPGYDIYVWPDGAVSFAREDCLEWWLGQLGDNDFAFFAHPERSTIQEEVEHIEDHLSRNRPYITSRYKGGLHREFLNMIQSGDYEDDILYASTAFIYRAEFLTEIALEDWWNFGTRYFTCDQVQLPYILKNHQMNVRTLDGHLRKSPYLTEVSKHK